jgi:hypothetical protein
MPGVRCLRWRRPGRATGPGGTLRVVTQQCALDCSGSSHDRVAAGAPGAVFPFSRGCRTTPNAYDQPGRSLGWSSIHRHTRHCPPQKVLPGFVIGYAPCAKSARVPELLGVPHRKRLRATVLMPACTSPTRRSRPSVAVHSAAPASTVGTAVARPKASSPSAAGRARRPPNRSRRLVQVQAPRGKSVRSGCRAWPSHRPRSRSRSRGQATSG